jgi:hypothetical protein
LENLRIIDYCGDIQYETIGELIHELKNQVHKNGIQIGTYKRILLVMIEALENIMKHSEFPSDASGKTLLLIPFFYIQKNAGKYIVQSANPIRKRSKAALTERIDFLNTLNQQSLKDHYKETITNGSFNEQGGAGLGLIEMAKISGNRMIYEFLPVNEDFVQFNLKIEIDE